MPDELLRLTNDTWDVAIDPAHYGRVISLIDRESGRVVVGAPDTGAGEVAEGGHRPFEGLDCWIKTGEHRDLNTGVLSAFAPIRDASLAATRAPRGIKLESRHAGYRFTLEWSLPEGAAPLRCAARLLNEDGAPATYQFEFFFIWTVDEGDWTAMALSIPGQPPRLFNPFGEIEFVAGGPASQPAVLWVTGQRRGVALVPCAGIAKFFQGIHGTEVILGPHSAALALARGQSLSAAFEIQTLESAVKAGLVADPQAVENELRGGRRRAIARAATMGGLAHWARPGPRALTRRAAHLTFQYAQLQMREAIVLIENVLAPAGYNQLMIEVGRAFPYRSHPAVAAPWAPARHAWRELAAAARAAGLEVIPQYNALGHQPESGLAGAYPELREDPGGWCLNPRHPKTIPYLCDLFDELLELFAPKQFHLGLDEVDVPSRPPTFGISPQSRGIDGGALFGDFVNGLHAHLRRAGQEVYMWADMLCYLPEHNVQHGLRPGTYRAIDALPRDLIMIDWVYTPVADYGGSRYLMDKGFRVMGATWHNPRAVWDFARFAAGAGLYGMCATTWTAPRRPSVPLHCILMGARAFSDPDAAPYERVRDEALDMALQISESAARDKR